MFRTQNTYVKKTRSGAIHKVVKEHYMRDDIWCGVKGCEECQGEPVLTPASAEFNTAIPSPYLIVVDTNIVLHHPDFLENSAVHDVIIPQSVQEEVKHRNQMAYKRLRQIIDQRDEKKRFYVFLNKHHMQTYAEQKSESANDYNDRLIRRVCEFYHKHVNEHVSQCNVLLLSDDKENREKSVQEHGILALSTREYIHGLGETRQTLLDYLSTVTQMDIDKEVITKIIYPEYWKPVEIKSGIKSNKLLQGTFEANKNNYKEANVRYISSSGEANTILISGISNMNRAIHNDIVVVEVLPEEEWKAPSRVVMEDKTMDLEVSLEEDSKETDARSSLRKTGRVVGIMQEKRRQYCGVLRYSDYDAHKIHHLFIPDNKRIPKVYIETRQITELKGMRIIVQVDSWPRSSRYPSGHFVHKIGAVGDKDVENEVILREHDVEFDPFPPSAIKELPELPWSVSKEEFARRLDLRHLPICSVDPPSCTDIDDALHCVPIPDTPLVEVGVHIADVSHFIRPKSSLDNEACKRGTTVYLADKRIDMVPPLLSTNLCSLREDEERLAFSVIWKINPETAEIIDTKFSKSVIKSESAFSYERAQEIIDDSSRQDSIAQGLRKLNELAKILKRKRTEKGALVLASPEVRFQISETHEPLEIVPKRELETNSMVEEFMLLANVSTADKTFSSFPKCAILRRHPAPSDDMFKPLLRATESRGLKVDISSAKALSDSLQKCSIPNNPYSNTLLKILTTRCMQQAKYFCSGSMAKEDFFHFGLANEIYTHFTSPIRRYPDILVHRLLAAAVGVEKPDGSLLDELKANDRCNNCNYRHTNAQWVGRASVELNTVILLKGLTCQEESYITEVKQNAVRVLVPKYGYEGFVFFENKEVGPNLDYDDDLMKLTINGTVTLAVFDKLTVEMKVVEPDIQHQRIQLKLVEPFIPEISVPSINKLDITPSNSDSVPNSKRIKQTESP